MEIADNGSRRRAKSPYSRHPLSARGKMLRETKVHFSSLTLDHLLNISQKHSNMAPKLIGYVGEFRVLRSQQSRSHTPQFAILPST